MTTSLPDDVRDALLRAGDRLGLFAGRLQWYQEVASTNDVAGRLAETGADEGTVVAADAQTSGRGRLGRQWSSPPGAGLYTSVILRPAPAVLGLITIAVGVAIAEGCQAATGLHATLKWPNDLYVGARKLAGVLAEAGTSDRGIRHVIVGFGINLVPAAYPAEVAARATSIEVELGRVVDRGLVLAECLAALSSRYGDLCERRTEHVLAAWRRRAAETFGRSVEWDVSGAVRRGVVDDIDGEGALLVRSARGTERLIAGEVRWL